SWSSPVLIDAHDPDSPAMGISKDGTYLYVSYATQPQGGSQPAMIAYSTDDGATWTHTVQVYDSGGDSSGSLSAGSGAGETYLAWDDFCGGLVNGQCQNANGQILIAKSSSYGASGSWSAPTSIAS